MEAQPQEMLQKNEQALPAIKNKYALIVFGRMGHGKSSFCRMLLDNSQKEKVKINVDIQSDTKQCHIYKSSSSYCDIFEDDFYIVDTPGNDSKAAAMFVAEQIDMVIQKYQFNIVGIAYELDMEANEQNEKGQSHIFTLLELLRMKYRHKSNLAFCVLSKFDKYYEDQQQIEKLSFKFQQIFDKNSYGSMWQRKIKWMSKPVADQNRYKDKIQKNEQVKKIYERQFKQLRQFFLTVKDKSQFLTHQMYGEDSSLFEAMLRNRFIYDYSKFQLRQQIIKLQGYINVFDRLSSEETEKNSGIFKYPRTFIFLFTGLVSATQAVGYHAALGYQALRLYPIGPRLLDFRSCLALSLGINVFTQAFQQIFFPNYGFRLIDLNFQVLVDIIYHNKLKLLIGRIIQEVYRNPQAIRDVIRGRHFTCQQLHFIHGIQCFDKDNRQLEVKKVFKDGIMHFRCKLQAGRNKMVFLVKIPTNESYQAYLKEMTKQYFNKQP